MVGFKEVVFLKPIAIIDSGFGGLSILKGINKQFPNETIIYFGDNGNAPYGVRCKDEITSLSLKMVDFICEFDPKVLIVACNTICACCIHEIRQMVGFPVIDVLHCGINSISPAPDYSDVGVIATNATVNSNIHCKSLQGAEVRACPEFIEIVEDGGWGTERAKKAVNKYLSNFKVHKLLIGCTHFSMLEDDIKEYMNEVEIIDPCREVIKEITPYLTDTDDGGVIFYTSGDIDKFCDIKDKILKGDV